MSWATSPGRVLALALAIVLMVPPAAAAQGPASVPAAGAAAVPGDPVRVLEVHAGQPAPADGIVFDEAALRRLVEDLRDLRTARASLQEKSETMARLDRQVAELTGALDAMQKAYRLQELALAKAEERDRIRAEMDAKSSAVMDRMESALTRADAALDRAARRIEKADDRIASMERRSGWSFALGGILGLVASVLTSGVLGGR